MRIPIDDIAAIEQAIRRYLEAHPRAFDTAGGVRDWWLTDLGRPCSSEAVHAALDRLVAGGLVARTTLPDGATAYAAGALSGRDPTT